jgi:hypothetical protein
VLALDITLRGKKRGCYYVLKEGGELKDRCADGEEAKLREYRFQEDDG